MLHPLCPPIEPGPGSRGRGAGVDGGRFQTFLGSLVSSSFVGLVTPPHPAFQARLKATLLSHPREREQVILSSRPHFPAAAPPGIATGCESAASCPGNDVGEKGLASGGPGPGLGFVEWQNEQNLEIKQMWE